MYTDFLSCIHYLTPLWPETIQIKKKKKKTFILKTLKQFFVIHISKPRNDFLNWVENADYHQGKMFFNSTCPQVQLCAFLNVMRSLHTSSLSTDPHLLSTMSRFFATGSDSESESSSSADEITPKTTGTTFKPSVQYRSKVYSCCSPFQALSYEPHLFSPPKVPAS